MSIFKELLEKNSHINEVGAPSGSRVIYQGQSLVKGFTDQPTWFPDGNTGKGLVVVIPSEDDEYDDVEKAWRESTAKAKEASDAIKKRNQRLKDLESKLSPEEKLALRDLSLKVLKAGFKKKVSLLGKVEKLQSELMKKYKV